jgi:ethanolamine ammonia-lyase large subunit
MDVALGADRMLAYFDTSGHDVQTLREVHDRLPGAEYLRWAIERGIFKEEGGEVRRGPRFGDVRALCASDEELSELCAATPLVYGFDAAGPRPASRVSRAARLDQAIARQAALSELPGDALGSVADLRRITTLARTHDEHLASPDRGARLSAESAARLVPEDHAVAILISDGLSAEAVLENVPDLLPVLCDGLSARGVTFGAPMLARYGRVKLAEPVADRLGARLVIHLIGERPGGDAASSRSLSAYLCLRVPDEARDEAALFSGHDAIRFEYSVVSNIYGGALPPLEAAAVIVACASQIFAHGAAGNRLVAKLGADRRG